LVDEFDELGKISNVGPINFGDHFKVEAKLEKVAGEGAYLLYIDSQLPIDFVQL